LLAAVRKIENGTILEKKGKKTSFLKKKPCGRMVKRGESVQQTETAFNMNYISQKNSI